VCTAGHTNTGIHVSRGNITAGVVAYNTAEIKVTERLEKEV